MKNIAREDLISLEDYAEQRAEYRQQVLSHKKNRSLQLGEAVTLLFEDRKTIQYQIQEMLRIEKIFESEGIEEELSAYNPLIPDGDNWKATMLIEYTDPVERKDALKRLVNIENQMWVQVGENEKIYAISDEDLDRTRDDKTSSVHFLRFQLSPELTQGICDETSITFGIDHLEYTVDTGVISGGFRKSIMNDLD